MSRRGGSVAEAQALADWLEADARVAALRLALASARERAAARVRDARMLQRAGRDDPFAAGVADAARLLEARAAAEQGRLEAAIGVEARLRARVSAARAALGRAPEAEPSCG